MTKITLEEAAKRTLKDVVGEACAQHETIVVTGPQGEVARIVPAVTQPGTPPAAAWKGRSVHSAEELAGMTPKQLETIGWHFPDESAWVDEITGTPGQGQGKHD